MVLTDLYKIDGKPMLAPDADVTMRFEDLDSAQSGRDESGFMHRIPVRKHVGVWEFSYSHLTREEYAYMMSLLPKGASFVFTHPSRLDSAVPENTRAYISKYGIVWHCARTDSYRDLKFSVIQC